MTWHELKTWPESFSAVLAGTKTHEVRRFDRDYVVGDSLVLREYLPAVQLEGAGYSGRRLVVDVTHVTPPATWGLPGDVGVMSVRRVDVLHCDFDKLAFVGPTRETCPVCGRPAYWQRSLRPDVELWNAADHRRVG